MRRRRKRYNSQQENTTVSQRKCFWQKEYWPTGWSIYGWGVWIDLTSFYLHSCFWSDTEIESDPYKMSDWFMFWIMIMHIHREFHISIENIMDMNIDTVFSYIDYMNYQSDPKGYTKKHWQMNIKNLSDLFSYLQ